MKIKDMTGIQFYGWVLTKLNNVKAFDQNIQELTLRANGFFGKHIEDDEKIEVIEKLRLSGIVIE